MGYPGHMRASSWIGGVSLIAAIASGCFAAHESDGARLADSGAPEEDSGSTPRPTDAGDLLLPVEDAGSVRDCAQTAPTAEGGGRTLAGELELRHAWALFNECRDHHWATIVLSETPDGLEGAPVRIRIEEVALESERGPAELESVVLERDGAVLAVTEGELLIEHVELYDFYGDRSDPGLVVGQLQVSTPDWNLLVFFQAPGCPAEATSCPF